MGIDLGARRIGVAVSDSGVIATPHCVIANEGEVVEKIAALGEKLNAETYVVGIPRRARPAAGEGPYRLFAEQLRQRTCKEVVLWDEALTTVAAAAELRDRGRDRRRAQREIDMHAAAVILQSYLDESRLRNGRRSS